MKEATQMIVVLVLICTLCGIALSGFREMTAERIENQVLINVQGPGVKRVLEGSQNDLIADRKKIKIDGQEILLFMGKKDSLCMLCCRFKNRCWKLIYFCLNNNLINT